MKIEISREKMAAAVKDQFRSPYTLTFVKYYDTMADRANKGLPYVKETKQLYAAAVGAIAAAGIRGAFRTSEKVISGRKSGWDDLTSAKQKEMAWAMEMVVDAFYMAYVDEVYDRAEAAKSK